MVLPGVALAMSRLPPHTYEAACNIMRQADFFVMLQDLSVLCDECTSREVRKTLRALQHALQVSPVCKSLIAAMVAREYSPREAVAN